MQKRIFPQTQIKAGTITSTFDAAPKSPWISPHNMSQERREAAKISVLFSENPERRKLKG